MVDPIVPHSVAEKRQMFDEEVAIQFDALQATEPTAEFLISCHENVFTKAGDCFVIIIQDKKIIPTRSQQPVPNFFTPSPASKDYRPGKFTEDLTTCLKNWIPKPAPAE